MKKVILILALVMIFGMVNVKALTESDLKTKLLNGFVIGGETIKPTDAQKNEIERYLNKYDLSDADATTISNKVDEIYYIAKNAGAKGYTELSSADKSKIVSIVAEISNQTSVKASLTTNGVLTIFESDGKTPFTKISDQDITKQTGSSNVIIITAVIVSVLGAAYVFKKVKEA